MSSHEQLFDPTPGNYEPYVSPQSAEPAVEQPSAIDLDEYDPYEGDESISSTQKSRIETLIRVNGYSRSNAEANVLGKVVGEAEPKAPLRTTNHHPGRKVQKTRVLRSPRGSRALDTRDSDARIEQARRADQLSAEDNARERTESIENPPQ